MQRFFRFHNLLLAIGLLSLIGVAAVLWQTYSATVADFSDLQYSWKDTKYKDVRSKIATFQDSHIVSTVEYPVTNNDMVNAQIAAKIDKFDAEFRSEVYLRALPADKPYTQNTSYQVIRKTPRFISLLVQTSHDLHEASPRKYVASWTFDLEMGKNVSLDALYGSAAPDGVARTVLYVKSALHQRLAKLGANGAYLDYITPEHLQNFVTPNARSLQFDFNPGAVAPSSRGPVSLTITTDNLQLFMQQTPAMELFSVALIGQAPELVPSTTAENAPNCDKEKCIALTFDDAPSRFTPELLDILKRHDAHATFFVIGRNIAGRESVVKRIHDEGNTIGNHTWSHPWLTREKSADISSEITRTNDVIQAITGAKPTYMRPPNGALDQTTLTVLGEQNMTGVLWSVDTRDWATQSSSVVYNRVISGAKPGSIVILHDVIKSSVNTVEPILTKLEKQGYTFVSLDELFGPNPAPGKAIYSAE